MLQRYVFGSSSICQALRTYTRCARGCWAALPPISGVPSAGGLAEVVRLQETRPVPETNLAFAPLPSTTGSMGSCAIAETVNKMTRSKIILVSIFLLLQ